MKDKCRLKTSDFTTNLRPALIEFTADRKHFGRRLLIDCYSLLALYIKRSMIDVFGDQFSEKDSEVLVHKWWSYRVSDAEAHRICLQSMRFTTNNQIIVAMVAIVTNFFAWNPSLVCRGKLRSFIRIGTKSMHTIDNRQSETLFLFIRLRLWFAVKVSSNWDIILFDSGFNALNAKHSQTTKL